MKVKKTFVFGTLWLLVMLPVAACIQTPGPATPAPSPATGNRGSAAVKSEWESLVEAARKEGTVVIYSGGSLGEATEASAKLVYSQYGVQIDYISGRGAEQITKITNERKAGLYYADAMLVGLGSFFNIISPMKITVPLQPLLLLPEVTDGSKWRTGGLPFADRDKTAIAFSLQTNHYTAINTDMVKANEITSAEDILDPKWKGKIVLNDPSVGGSGAGWFQYFMLGDAYGREKGREYMMKLVKQEPVIIRDERLQLDWVARGKYAVGLGVSVPHLTSLARAGAPIKLLAMKEGGYLNSGSFNLIVLDRAPHPNAIKLFANWVLSREGGTIMAKYSGYPSARLDVSTEGFDPMFIPGSKDVLPGEDWKKHQAELLVMAAEIFKPLLK